ncbi:MAG: D-glycero-beta-D-manno-heptose-7-phosphate kinase [Deltaproteobacteria bacterium]|nr:D-glycero-beta-D-manno-heptose-7-phosphate kinase [Deltaproteobacteria bacterium]
MESVITKKKAYGIIEKFSKAKVLVVGDIMVDHFIWGKVSRISQEAPVPVVDVQKDNLMLGGCANVLNNICSMGGMAYGTGVVGADDTGERLRKELRKRHIDTQGLIVERNRPTTLKTRIIAHGQQVVRFDRENRASVNTVSTGKIIGYIEKRVRDGLGAIVISDYSKGVITGALLDGIRRAVSGRSIVVCVDPKHHDFSLYHGFDVITPNHHEAERALGIEDMHGDRVGKDPGIRKAVQNLLTRHGIKSLLVTRGEEGMSLFERNGGIVHTLFPTKAREVFDVTGAGDTVIGVFALSMASGATFREAAALANHAAGIVVGKIGTATVSREELKKSL